MTKRYFALIGLLIAMDTNADVVIGAGMAKAGLEPNGTWRQETFQQDINKRGGSWMIGWEDDLTDHFSYRGAYHNWGRQTLAAGYLSGGDYRFNPDSANRCFEKCPATNWAFSSYESKGLEISGKYQLNLPLKPYVRLGVVAYSAEQTTDVPDMGGAETPDAYRRSFCVYHMASHGISGMGGVGIKYKNIALEYNKVPNVRAKDAAFRGVTELLVTMSVPF